MPTLSVEREVTLPGPNDRKNLKYKHEIPPKAKEYSDNRQEERR